MINIQLSNNIQTKKQTVHINNIFYKKKQFLQNHTMSLVSVKSVRNSCLNFSIRCIPCSLYLSIRKSFSNVKCDFCDVRSESLVNLQKSMRFYHMKSYSAQTQDVLREDKGVESYSAESHNSSDVKEKVLKSNKYENYPLLLLTKRKFK